MMRKKGPGGRASSGIESSILRSYQILFYFRWNHDCTSTATTTSHGMLLGEGLIWKTVLKGVSNGLNFERFKIKGLFCHLTTSPLSVKVKK